MSAILLDIKPGDEVIVPSYTFVSTVNAFVLRGAKIVFSDSREDHPNIDADRIENLITSNTKAIVVVHYAGFACDMDKIMDIAKRHELFVVEDAAQAIDSYYKGKPLGSIGHFGTFSFHETKNIQCGEGGLLAINEERFIKRAEIIWEKGTNRSAFFRGEVDKYGWVDIGSSFLPSELVAAFLYAQLENLKDIQAKRISIWNRYNNGFKQLEISGKLKLPKVFDFSTNNAHMYYLVCKDLQQRDALIKHLIESGYHAVFHYLSLHKSEYYNNKHDGRDLPNADKFSDQLVRMPMYYELEESQVDGISQAVVNFYK